MGFLPWFILLSLLAAVPAEIYRRLRLVYMTVTKQKHIPNWLPETELLKELKLEAYVLHVATLLMLVVILKFGFDVDTALFKH